MYDLDHTAQAPAWGIPSTTEWLRQNGRQRAPGERVASEPRRRLFGWRALERALEVR
jgi:hypothetical protein